MKDVQQKQCSAGVQTVFTMSLKRSQFLVKNFTDNQITVKLGEIEQYKKLSIRTPTTIVENNYNTWMKATYKSTESV